MIGKVIEGRYAGASVHKLPDKNVLYIQTEDGSIITLSKKNAISVENVTDQYPSYGTKVMMVMWNDFETSIIQYGKSTDKVKKEIQYDAPNNTSVMKSIGEVDKVDLQVKHGLKTRNKKPFVCLAIIVAIIVIVVTIFQGTEFKRVKSKVVDIAGMCYSGAGYFTIDTYPDAYKNLDELTLSLLLPDTQEDALKGIRYANEALGFNGSVYSKMMETTALMGRQSEENRKYIVSWTYHPDDGLEVTYEKK